MEKMKKTIYNKYDKAQIPSLPRALFEGRIVVVLTAGEAERAVDFLLSQPILGVDTETRPSFTRGKQYKVSLLQVATHDVCFLFRLNLTGMTPAVRRLLEDTTVPKIGLSWHDDLNSLHRLAEFKPGLFIDLQNHVREIGVEDLSLQKLYANLFGQRISKHERLTNWEADVLKEPQKRYAATDAWACIMLYEEMQRLKLTGDYELVIVPECNQEEKDETSISEEG
jgi:ribonuclease D